MRELAGAARRSRATLAGLSRRCAALPARPRAPQRRDDAVRRERLPLRRSSPCRSTAAARVGGDDRGSACKRLPAAVGPGERGRGRARRRPGQAGAADRRRRSPRRSRRCAAAATSLVFDQRGTGRSGALTCSVARLAADASRRRAPARAQLGAARAAATARSTASTDIEALRVAGGYEQLVLYGVSYGTQGRADLRRALPRPRRGAGARLRRAGRRARTRSRARRSPRSRRVLRELCAGGACRRATPSVDGRPAPRRAQPRAPAAARARHLAARRRRVASRSTRPALWDVLLAGDLNPALRAELPGALRAMLRGDRTPILRLRARADGPDRHGRRPTRAARRRGGLQTSGDRQRRRCSPRRAARRRRSPGPRGAARAARLRAGARRPRGGCRAAPFAPFGRASPLDAGLFELCAHWPVAAGRRRAGRPAARTSRRSCSSGGADLRTSTEQARAAVAGDPAARASPSSRAPGTRCSAATSGTAPRASSQAFAAGDRAHLHAGRRTSSGRRPRRRRASRRSRADEGARRTITAVLATLDDVRRQLIGDAIAAAAARHHAARGPAGCAAASRRSEGSIREPARRVVRSRRDGLRAVRVPRRHDARCASRGRSAARGDA